MYILNTWYVTAWSHEVTSEPLARTICEIDLVLFRNTKGKVAVLADRCAHRAYPLSAGVVVGDSIECGYHGFQFNCDGVCTRVPAQSAIPERALVQTYPVVEKDGWVWVWPGDAALADESLLPDTHYMTSPDWAPNFHTYLFECRADLIHDNLLDLTHESFIHKSTVGDDYIYEHGITVEVEGNVVSADRLMPAVAPPPLYATTMGLEGEFDRFHCTEFHVPNYHILHSGITGQGRPREEGYLIKVLNGITPVDADHTWYFYCFARNFAIDNSEATAQLQEGLGTVLDEDAAALRLQEIGMKKRPSNVHDVLIAQDAGVAKARRIQAQILAAEQESAATKVAAK
jgi:vanillate O-demethylase monooxygenase subunit